ncbi:MAG: response regulator [Chitinophagaceae bacterium]
MKVLIIESSAHIASRLEEMIAAAQLTSAIYISGSYENGAVIFHEKKPDVVLLSISLPEDKSLQLLAEIKAAAYKTRVIVLSRNIDLYIHEQCLLLGADYFLDKYYEFEKIPAVMQGIYDRSH